MDIITPDQNNSVSQQKAWFKKPSFYILVFVIAIVSFAGFRMGFARSNIEVNNEAWWKTFTNIFEIDNKNEDYNPIPKDQADRLDVLVMGIRGENDLQDGGLLTDSMMVVSIDKKTRNAAMISIPRDLYIDMTGSGGNGKDIHVKGKINEIYEKGLAKNYGLGLEKELISRITGIHIDKVIIFDHIAFKTIVDKLGGVDVYLTQPFSEPAQWGYPFSLPAGNNHLNGDQALYYARSRYSTTDFDRAARQQVLTGAIKAKAQSLGYMSNPIKATSLYSELKKDIQTDFSLWDMSDIITLANTFGPKAPIKHYVISTDNLLYQSTSADHGYILLTKTGDFSGMQDLFKNILNPAPNAEKK